MTNARRGPYICGIDAAIILTPATSLLSSSGTKITAHALEAAGVPALALDADMASHVQDGAEAEGIKVRLATPLEAIETDDDGRPVHRLRPRDLTEKFLERVDLGQALLLDGGQVLRIGRRGGEHVVRQAGPQGLVAAQC